MTPNLVSAARSLLGLSQDDLAKLSGVSRASISNFERSASGLIAQNRKAVISSLEAAGIEFIEGGVRLKPKGKK